VLGSDGKLRHANDALLSSIDEHVMRGAMVAMDDAWSSVSDKNASMVYSFNHFGQSNLALELLEADYEVRRLPRFPAMRNSRRAALVSCCPPLCVVSACALSAD
jgi:hypothetical protein